MSKEHKPFIFVRNNRWYYVYSAGKARYYKRLSNLLEAEKRYRSGKHVTYGCTPYLVDFGDERN